MLFTNKIVGFFELEYFKKEVRDRFDFWHVDRHQRFHQVDIIVFGVSGDYPNNKFGIS